MHALDDFLAGEVKDRVQNPRALLLRDSENAMSFCELFRTCLECGPQL